MSIDLKFGWVLYLDIVSSEFCRVVNVDLERNPSLLKIVSEMSAFLSLLVNCILMIHSDDKVIGGLKFGGKD